jgi:5-methylcytosine-specific restriction endonuclease McrA
MIDLAATISAMKAAGMADADILTALSRSDGNNVTPYRPRYAGLQRHFMPKERDWLTLRWKVLSRDRFTCQYCGHIGQHPECGTAENPTDLTADHVHPLSRGGDNSMGNLKCSCLSCNSSKGDKLLPEWQRWAA